MISEIEIEPYPELDREFAGIEASRKEHRHAIAVGSFCQRPDSRGHQRLSAPRHLADERGTRRRRSSRPPRATPPERAETCPMPTENGRGLDEQGCFAPSWRDSRGENNREALPGRPHDAAGNLPLGNDELLSKKRVLRNQLHTMATKSAASPETNRRRSITSRVIHSPRGDGICSRKAIVTRPIGLR